MNDCTLPRVLDADRRGIGCGAIFVGENHKATTILIQSQTLKLPAENTRIGLVTLSVLGVCSS